MSFPNDGDEFVLGQIVPIPVELLSTGLGDLNGYRNCKRSYL